MESPMSFVSNWITDQLVNGLESFLLDLIVSLPILIGVSIGVYVLIGMVSKTLAKFGVGCVFVYGGLIILL